MYQQMHLAVEDALVTLNRDLTIGPRLVFSPKSGARKGQELVFADGEALLEWEVPFERPQDWPATAHAAFDAYHAARGAMQAAVARSIAEHAETVTLFNEPTKDRNKQRITGPYSIEAVPSPTVVSLDETVSTADPDTAIARSGETARQATWRDELMKTGIRGKAGQILRFAELETIPGVRHLHASGSLAETGERVVVSFGPHTPP